MEASSTPQSQTQAIMLKYGRNLRKLRDVLTNSTSLDKRYISARTGFTNVANEFFSFTNSRKTEIDDSMELSTLFDVLQTMIVKVDPRFGDTDHLNEP